MVIDFHQGYLFQHIFKTAGTTIKRTLQSYRYPDHVVLEKWCKDKTYKAFDNALPLEFGNEHISFDQFNALWPYMEYTKYYKFCFVRQTYDWIVAGYKHCCDISYFKNYPEGEIRDQHVRDFTFEFYVKNWVIPDLTQLDFMKFEGKVIIDKIGSFERLQDDFNEITDTIGFSRKQLSKYNSSEGRNYAVKDTELKANQHYSLWFTDELLDLVNKRFKEELDYFNFKFEDKR